MDKQHAYILNFKNAGITNITDYFETNKLDACCINKDLLKQNIMWNDFLKLISSETFVLKGNEKFSENIAKSMWRFLREMDVGDLVVVPDNTSMYIAEILSPAYIEQQENTNKTIYHRNVKWLNKNAPIPMCTSCIKLQSKVKFDEMCICADEILDEIKLSLEAHCGVEGCVYRDYVDRQLIEESIKSMCVGEKGKQALKGLTDCLLNCLGAASIKILDNDNKYNVDLLAFFNTNLENNYAVAVKVYGFIEDSSCDESSLKIIEKVIKDKIADAGWVISLNDFTNKAIEYCNELYCEYGIKTQLISSRQFASLIHENMIRRNVMG